MLLAGVEQQCIVLRCIWWRLGFFPPIYYFLSYFLFSAFSFIASVKVVDDDRVSPSRQYLTYAPDMGLML